ncbi:dimethyl sulfoxide reductase subunit A [Shewanella sp. D64]|uniref:DMSO/selenate family reductase complex A subunit n=1 Tax=unclassified Shewanella TaxID=196818 RepID=UPI0022BA577F|nr:MULTISPECIES: DMSO/selenate family reductase complex A subunit [unclassified Shewanella]MEC4727449.1 dimethyl sulfoxide reductase subunit A [Shewanella sp. D64]MEC4739604.1 dimethyl sulfoxide reductase subunit A [Shewanella sp. E94]WBJ96015.1 dimethyl sulfoxide reductase subunit A [Shewanella sp. MTB7]
MERRSFLKASAALGCAATVVGCKTDSDEVNVVPPQPPLPEEQMNWSACLVNCGSNCPVKVFSRDGVITRVETDHETTDEYGVNHQIRACARGRSLKQRTYAPDRLKTPMKRVGKRGEGKFVPISWDDAAAEIASELQRITNEYGNKSILKLYGTGAYYGFSSSSCFNRVLNLNGGFLNIYGNYSWAQQNEAASATGFGSTSGSNLLALKDSDLFLGIGYNPSEMRQSGSGEGYDYLQALQSNNNLEVIMVDPRYTDSMAGKEDHWYAIRPGTDAAFAEGIAFEMISSGWVERNSKEFLDKYCVGYDKTSLEELIEQFQASGDESKTQYIPYIKPEDNYKDYILGEGAFAFQGPRTPEWAATVCGISEDNIKSVANKIMNAKAPFIITGAGVNRHANGEQAMRSCYMLSFLTGKVGQPGVSNGALPSQSSLSRSGMSGLSNPVKESISFFTWADAIVRGKEMTARKDGVRGLKDLDTPLGANVKAIFAINSNALINQHSDCNGTAKILEEEGDCELIVVCDCWMTPSAKFADIILPDTSWLESNDLVNDSYASGIMGYLVAMKAAVEPMWDCKSMYDMCALIADKMGKKGEYTEGKDEAGWLAELYERTRNNANNAAAEPALPATYEEAQKIGVFRAFNGTPKLALDSYINGGKPLSTPSGKIEIYALSMAQKGSEWTFDDTVKGDYISAIPMYQATWDGYDDEDTKTEYPLQLMGYHTKGRTHSSFHNVPWLREAAEDAIWMNPLDADARGLAQGSKVHVWNDRGTIELPVRITPRVTPGVVALGQGAWYQPDLSRIGPSGHAIDAGGCINTLTRYQPSPLAKANPQHTNRVQIAKA